MARKKKHEAHENHERWLVSYADFITLLFAFFVVMFASSQADKSKAQRFSEGLNEALEGTGASGIVAKVAAVLGGTVDNVGQGNAMMKGPGGAKRATKNSPPDEVLELIPALERLGKELQREIAEGKLELSLEPRGLVVSLRQAAFFPSGTDVIDPATYPILDKIAELVNSRTNRVRMEGHTDSVPIHTARYPSNWELSSARAIAMLRLLTDRFKVDHMRMSVTGYADTIPVAPNDTPEGRARNRRVDIVLLSEMGLRPVKGGGEPASDEPTPAVVEQAPSGAAEQAAPAAEHRAAIAEPPPNAAETSPTAAASPANAAEPAKSTR
jgi:chemotaxis protein MotB